MEIPWRLTMQNAYLPILVSELPQQNSDKVVLADSGYFDHVPLCSVSNQAPVLLEQITKCG
jgi:hypothetical protein